MFKRLWVGIPALYTGWTFFTLICCKNCIVCLKKTENKLKRPGLAHLKKRLLKFPGDPGIQTLQQIRNLQASVKICSRLYLPRILEKKIGHGIDFSSVKQLKMLSFTC